VTNNGILIGKGTDRLYLLPRLANRHGLIAGATGTGKTVSLQVLAEGFSSIGVPVFLADVKGDLAGLSQPGGVKPGLRERAQAVGREPYLSEAFPVIYWDLFGTQGHGVRATVSEMGPLLLSRLLELNDTQEGVVNVIFKVADEEGLLLLDFKDLRAILGYAAKEGAALRNRYGSVNSASIGAIQRRLLVLEQQGGEHFFGEPGLDIWDLMRHDERGRGYISVLAADRLIHSPRLYSTFLLWLLAELFEELPEMGDPDKPRLVFFFDEAHLLFDAAPRALLDKVEQVVRLIRSKGVGVYFVSQSPLDIPDGVLGQLGNRIQHALRAFTPRDQRAVRAAAETFRRNPNLETAEAITALGVGEALVSTLDQKGIPTPVECALICPPASRLGPVTSDERARVVAVSPVAGRYDQVQDRQSAYESLMARAAAENLKDAQAPPRVRSAPGGRGRQSIAEAMAKSLARSVGSSLGRQIARGLLGALFKGR
jgi:DNA helicase HerA-like ATPase